MCDELWEKRRDYLHGEITRWLEDLGFNALQVKGNLKTAAVGEIDDLCGKAVIERAFAVEFDCGEANVWENNLRVFVDDCGQYLTITLPIPVREFMRAWNEGVLQ